MPESRIADPHPTTAVVAVGAGGQPVAVASTGSLRPARLRLEERRDRPRHPSYHQSLPLIGAEAGVFHPIRSERSFPDGVFAPYRRRSIRRAMTPARRSRARKRHLLVDTLGLLLSVQVHHGRKRGGSSWSTSQHPLAMIWVLDNESQTIPPIQHLSGRTLSLGRRSRGYAAAAGPGMAADGAGRGAQVAHE